MLTLSTVQTFMLVFSWQIHWMQLVVGGVFALDPDNESFTAPAMISSRVQHHHTEAQISELLSDTFLDAVSSQVLAPVSSSLTNYWIHTDWTILTYLKKRIYQEPLPGVEIDTLKSNKCGTDEKETPEDGRFF